MRTIQSFDPTAAANGSITTQTVNPCSVVVLFNHSLNGLALTMPNGDTANLPPWYFRYYYMAMPGNIQWAKSFQLATTGPPVSLVTGEIYEPSEASQRTFTEGPLPLSMNIGNTVNTTGTGSSNSVQNDNNASGTTYIESTVTGSPGSNVIVKNQGIIQILQWISSTLTQIFKTDPGAASVVQLGNTGLQTEVLGSLLVDQVASILGQVNLGNSSLITGKDSTAVQGNIFGVDGNGNTFIQHHPKNNQTVFYDKNGSALLTVDATGNIAHNNNKSLQWKDSGGTVRNVANVDASNNVNLQGITTKDIIQFLKSDGTVQGSWDLINAILSITGVSQSVTGDGGGTMTAVEVLAGPLKIVLLKQNNYKQAGAAQLITLKNAFTFIGAIFNFGCGGIVQAAANVIGNNGQVTWGTGTSAGTNATNAQIPTDAAGFSALAFTQVGSNGGYASAHTGLGIYIGQ